MSYWDSMVSANHNRRLRHAKRNVKLSGDKKTKAKKRGKKNQKAGKKGEKEARAALLEMGHLQAVPIPTTTHWIFVMKQGNMPLHRRGAMHRSTGDINSMDADGRWCLSEVKAHDEKTLPWSQLSRRLSSGETYHQSDNLDAHLSLHPKVSAFLIWVRGKETAVLSWPVAGFKARSSVKWSDALEWRLNK